jgi:WD40 repeat protein
VAAAADAATQSCAHTPAGVSALDWSGSSPNLLAVGLHDGNVAIYDVRSRQPRPVMESVAGAGKHNDPVWKVGHSSAGGLLGSHVQRFASLGTACSAATCRQHPGSERPAPGPASPAASAGLPLN